MNVRFLTVPFAALLALALGMAGPAPVRGDELIVNGGSESGLSGWTVVNLPGGDGSFQPQSGLSSPVNGEPVPAPSEGSFAAMTDAQGPGSHVLYQDIFIPVGLTIAELRFDLFLGNREEAFYAPPTLDFGAAAFNQQARVDIIRTAADPFSLLPDDVLQTIYQTNPGDATVSGYLTIVADLGALLAAHGGETLRLRFAQVDNVGPFQMGVDNVRLNAVPEPSTLLLYVSAGAILGATRLAGRRARRDD
ncbi:MAG: hypothetical protein U0790_18835 [Isosphaeraceae bacterium]